MMLKTAPKQTDKIIYTKVVGVTFEDRQDRILRLLSERKLVYWTELYWVWEKDNEHDENAVAIFADKEKTEMLGHLRSTIAQRFVAAANAGMNPRIVLKKISGIDPKRYIKGLNIIVYFDGKLVRKKGEEVLQSATI